MVTKTAATARHFEDIAIAIAATVRGFIVLTVNERHFARLGVQYINPLKQLPR